MTSVGFPGDSVMFGLDGCERDPRPTPCFRSLALAIATPAPTPVPTPRVPMQRRSGGTGIGAPAGLA